MPTTWIKQKRLKRPIFRGFEGATVSQENALRYDKLNDDMQRQTLGDIPPCAYAML